MKLHSPAGAIAAGDGYAYPLGAADNKPAEAYPRTDKITTKV